MAEADAETDAPVPRKLSRDSALLQVLIISAICFCCPGMFNALTGMGGGGQEDDTAANDANTALYTAFAVFGLLGGGIHNILGPTVTVAAGCSTYVLYAGSFLYYNHHRNETFAIVAGGLLGAGAGLLWAAQGAIMTSYPTHKNKGRYISLFWCIFNLGGVLGGFLPFALNYNRRGAASVNDATYIAFMGFMSVGVVLSLLLRNPRAVRRSDGTRPASPGARPSTATEMIEVAKLVTDWKMAMMLVPSWASNFFYTYQFNHVNGRLFNVRTRGFNNVFYWAAQMVGSLCVGLVLDLTRAGRRRRGFAALAVVAIAEMAVWSGGLANQLRYSRDSAWPSPLLDFKDSGTEFAGPFVLYMCYGLVDAMFQTVVYWTIGALADDSVTLSRYAGFYKGVQSAGAAVAWQTDKRGTSLLTEMIVNWALTAAAIPVLGALIAVAVRDDRMESKSVDAASGSSAVSYVPV